MTSIVTKKEETFTMKVFYILICCFVADIDECKLNLHTCSEHAECENIKGNYTCVCKDGYNGDGFTCVGMSRVYFLLSKLINRYLKNAAETLNC